MVSTKYIKEMFLEHQQHLQHIRMISEGSCDTDRNNDAENSALITGINYIIKSTVSKIFHNITVFNVFLIK